MKSNTASVRSPYGLLFHSGVVVACLWISSAFCLAQASYAPPKYDIGDIFFADSLHGWILGTEATRSILFRTEDGGNLWEPIPMRIQFYRVFFLNAKLGWGLTADMSEENRVALRLYMTSDGGKAWSYKSTVNASSRNSSDIITDFRFVDAKHGWFVGESSGGVGIALQTNDGGKSIREVSAISGKKSLSRIDNIGSKKLWIFGTDAIFATFDGGQMWRSQLDADHLRAGYRSGVMLRNGIGWAATDHAAILKTTDFGKTWSVVLKREEGWFTDISFWDSNLGCAVGASRRLECTLDGGASWTPLSVLPSKEIDGHDLYKRILFTSSNRCWVLSEGGWLFRSDDGGISWHDVELSGAAHEKWRASKTLR